MKSTIIVNDESEIAIAEIDPGNNIKEIETNAIPFSSTLDTRTFSRVLDADRVVASYKMYWLLGILEEVGYGKEEIDFKRIISRMIVYAWYPILKYRLNFGNFDNLKMLVNYVAEEYKFTPNCDEQKLLEFLYNNEDKKLNKMMTSLENNVPYRLISPFFEKDLKGKKDHEKEKIITELSLKSNSCLYKIIKDGTNKIVLNHGWGDYLKDNYRIIKSWIYYKLVCFLQKRNQNVPAIAFKLEAPKNRSLVPARKLWEKIIIDKRINDIYTGMEFNGTNYEKYGVLSIDHFIPWSFVLHDEMWNLVPTFKNINSKKSDNLLLLDRYIKDFCDIQYRAFSYMCDKKLKSALEEYTDVFNLENPIDYYKSNSKDSFEKKMRLCISPLYQIADNQGFQVVDKLI